MTVSFSQLWLVSPHIFDSVSKIINSKAEKCYYILFKCWIMCTDESGTTRQTAFIKKIVSFDFTWMSSKISEWCVNAEPSVPLFRYIYYSYNFVLYLCQAKQLMSCDFDALNQWCHWEQEVTALVGGPWRPLACVCWSWRVTLAYWSFKWKREEGSGQ